VTRQGTDQAEVRRNFEIRASNNADMSNSVVLCSQGSTALAYQATFSCSVSNTNTYRYIAAWKTVNEYFYIAELRVFGTSSNTGANRRNPVIAEPHAVQQTINVSAGASLTSVRDNIRTLNGNMTGDIIVSLAGGTYTLGSTLELGANDSGTNGYNVVWKAASGATPVISGGTTITGWSLFDSAKNIYRASVSTSLNTRQLFVNGVRAQRARGLINQGDGNWARTGTGYTTTSVTSLQNLRNPSHIELVDKFHWKSYRCPVSSVSGNTVTMQNPCWKNSQLHPGYEMGTPDWVENVYEFLDAEGEWYLDKPAGFIYYKPLAGQTVSSATFIVPTTETLIRVQGTLAAPVRNIKFMGLTFSNNTWLRPSTSEGYAVVQAGWHYTGSGRTAFSGGDLSRTPGAISLGNNLDIQFERNTFKNLGSIGVDFLSGSQFATILGNRFEDVSSSAIQFGDTLDTHLNEVAADDRNKVTDFNISNNYILKTGAEYLDSVGIFGGYVSNANIVHNEITNLPYSGISVGWGWSTSDYPMANNQISYNLVNDVMKNLFDGGGIYTLSKQPNSNIHSNYVHHTNGEVGLYLDNGSSGFTVYNNVVTAVGEWLVLNSGSENNTARDNFTDNPNCRNCSYTGSGNSVTNTMSSTASGATTVINNAGREAAYR
jgi:hypothetical protein